MARPALIAILALLAFAPIAQAAPPVVSFATPADGAYAAVVRPAVTGTTDDAGTPVSVTFARVGGGFTETVVAASAASWTATPAGTLPDGEYLLTATQSNVDGASTPVTRTIRVDTTAPVVSIIEPGAGDDLLDATPEVTATVGVAASDTTPVVTFRQGATVVQASESVTGTILTAAPVSALTAGAWDVEVIQTDLATNSDTATHTVGVTPTTLVFTQPTTPSNNAEPTFMGDGGSVAEGAVDPVIVWVYEGTDVLGDVVQTTSDNVGPAGEWSLDTATLDAGTYTAQALQTDEGDNVIASDPRTFVIDLTAPALVVTAPAGAAVTSSRRPAVSGTTDDPAQVAVTYARAGGATTVVATTPAGGFWSATPPGDLADGAYTITVEQTDGANPVTITRALTIDSVAPSVALTGPDALTSDSTPEITGTAGTATGDAAAVAVVIKQGSITVQSLTATPSGGAFAVTPAALPDGSYTATATQADAAGNAGASAARAFRIDTTVPVAVAVVPPGDVTAPSLRLAPTRRPYGHGSRTVRVGLVVEAGATLRCRFDGRPLAQERCKDPVLLDDLRAGTHRLEVVAADAADAAGNTTAPLVVTFTVDVQAPEVVVGRRVEVDRAGRLEASLLCPKPQGVGGCSGTLDVRRNGRSLLVEPLEWTAAPGRRVEVGGRLTTAGKRLLRRRGAIARLVVVATDGAGNTGTAAHRRDVTRVR